MQSPQTKKLIINIATIVIVAGILGAGYWVFIKNKEVVQEAIAPSEVKGNQAVAIGVEVDHTFKELANLKQSITTSKNIFNMSAFKNLEDFSVAIPTEPLSRENPFVPASWKAEMNKKIISGGK